MLAGESDSTAVAPCRGRPSCFRLCWTAPTTSRSCALRRVPAGDRGSGRKRRGAAGGGRRGRHAGRLPDRSEPGGRHRRGGRGRLERHFDDPAHGQGPRVPRRVHDRHGGRGVPSPAFSGRARRARRGAASLLCGGDPGQGASLHLLRLVPEPVGQTQYNPPSRFVGEIPDHLVRSSGAQFRTHRRSREEARHDLVEAAMRRGRAGMPVQGTGAEALGLRAGDAVVHGRYGEGVVIEVSGEGADAEATIRFPGVGREALQPPHDAAQTGLRGAPATRRDYLSPVVVVQQDLPVLVKGIGFGHLERRPFPGRQARAREAQAQPAGPVQGRQLRGPRGRPA